MKDIDNYEKAKKHVH